MKVKVKWKWKQGLLRCQHWLGFKCPQSPSRRTDWSHTNWGFTFNRKLLKEQQIWQNTNWRQNTQRRFHLAWNNQIPILFCSQRKLFSFCRCNIPGIRNIILFLSTEYKLKILCSLHIIVALHKMSWLILVVLCFCSLSHSRMANLRQLVLAFLWTTHNWANSEEL